MESALGHRRLWLSLGWALVLVVIGHSLMPALIQVPMVGGDKLGHLLAYGSLMVWFSSLYEKEFARLILASGFLWPWA